MLGRTVGNYRIVSELAKGGMGAVYRAHHVHLPREVVVKSIQLDSYSESAQEMLKARFRREAFIQSQFDHPNIVRVLEFFEARDNYYLVMEYVPGVSLRELLDQQGVPFPKQAVHLFKQILSALDYAHNFSFLDEAGNRQKGIIHRDINPSNLLMDNNGRVRIADFGTVKLAGSTRLTQIGFHPGTIEYMSPEQLRGGEIDSRSDIYSVGVTFYEMLTGQLPFPPKPGGSDWEVRKGHIELPPPPISKLKPEVPSDLAELVMRSLQKSPDKRFQSASEFLKAVKSLNPVGLENKRKVRGYGRKFSSAPPFIVKTIIHPDSDVFQQRMDNLFESGDAVTIPVPQLPCDKLFSDPIVTQPAAKKQTSGGLLERFSPLITKYNLPRNSIIQVALLLCLTAGFAFFFLVDGKQNLQIAMTNLAGVSSPTTTSGFGLTTLAQAQDLEKQEHYDQAILAYESVILRDPKAETRDGLTIKIMELRTFQTLIEAGQIAEQGERLMAAREHFMGALQIRPNSKMARTRLAEIDRKLNQHIR